VKGFGEFITVVEKLILLLKLEPVLTSADNDDDVQQGSLVVAVSSSYDQVNCWMEFDI
jgi:hypothetical protein